MAASKLKSKSGNLPLIRVLIVEDSEDDALLMIRELKKGGFSPVAERVETSAAMLSALQDKTWDIILADYKMPHFSGSAAITLLKETNIDIPLIIVSGTIGEETAVECMLLGAQDYIMKGNMSRLVPAIKREIAEAKSRAERKLAEQAFIASEVRFRELFENMISCVAVYGAVADGADFVLKDFNRAAEIAEKIDRQRIIGQSLLQVFPDAREMGLLEVLQRVWRTGRSEHVPAAYYKDARNEGWRENYVYKLPTGEVVALYNDITERKQAERKLLESEGKYRLLVENSSEAIFIAQDEMIKFANRASLALFGSSNEVLTSTSFVEFIHPEDREMVVGSHLRRLRGEKVRSVYTFRIVTAAGMVKWVEIRATVISWQGKPATLNFLTDITDRKQAEEALQQSKKQLQDAYSLAEIGSFSWKATDRTITFSEELGLMAGMKSQQRTFPDNRHPLIYTRESWDLLKKTFATCLKTGNPIQVELEFVHPDGNNRWLNWIGGVIYDDSGKITGMNGTAQNITERKKAELQRKAALNALRESEEKYRWVLDNMVDIIAVMDMDLHFTYVSPSIMRLRGYTAEEAMAQTMEQVMTPESLQIVAQVFAEEMKLEASGTADPARSRIVVVEQYKKDGSIVWMENHLSFIRDETQKAVGIISLSRDITDRRRMEEDLKKSEEKYRSVFENAQEGIYRVTPAGRITMANPAMAMVFGYATPEELMHSITDIAGQLYVQPGERKKIMETVAKQGSLVNYETQFYRKNGSIIWGSLTMSTVRDEKGNILHYEGLIEDITNRKESAERIRKALGATIQAIAVIVETRDPYTAGHQKRVSDLGRAIATEMNLTADQIEGIRMAAAIHDLGKISVPAEILSKPTKLTNIEFNLIKIHPQSGHDILKEIEFPWPVAKIVLEHHERINGSGYPNGLKGDDILLESRVLAVADVVEAMASHRPYRPGLGVDAALNEIEKNRGVFYDNTVVDACLRLFREKGFKLEGTLC